MGQRSLSVPRMLHASEDFPGYEVVLTVFVSFGSQGKQQIIDLSLVSNYLPV